MASTLVRAGATLAGGSPAVVIILQAVLKSAATSQDDSIGVDEWLAIAGFILGLGMVVGGIGVFYRFRTAISLDDQLLFNVQTDWKFKDVVTALVDDSFVKFEGFSTEELETPMREQPIIVPSVEFALRGLGTLAKGGTFPPYEVVIENGTIYVRKTNG